MVFDFLFNRPIGQHFVVCIIFPMAFILLVFGILNVTGLVKINSDIMFTIFLVGVLILLKKRNVCRKAGYSMPYGTGLQGGG